MHSTNVVHTRCHRYLLRSERSDQCVIDIDVNDAFTFQVQSIRVKRQSLSVGERLKSPGRDERFSIVKTPDFATRVHFFVMRLLSLPFENGGGDTILVSGEFAFKPVCGKAK